jgi:rSAM/selenodomain-associated transferase 1
VTALVVIAKEPVPGAVKTRLCPPCAPQQAAQLARASLLDTLEAVLATPGVRPTLLLDGMPGPWLPLDLPVVAQRGEGLAERLAAGFEDVPGPALLVGMDTPQVTPAVLASAINELHAGVVDCVLGGAPDGGYWAIGLRRPNRDVFNDVPMSSPRTLQCQRDRLIGLGLSTRELPTLRDVDQIEDARAVAALCPQSRFARTLNCVQREWGREQQAPARASTEDNALATAS